MSDTILQISQNHFIQGGSDRYFFDISALLEDRGHTIIPFCAHDDRNQPSQFSSYFPSSVNFENPEPHKMLSYFYNMDARKKLTSLVENQNISLAHLHIYYGKLTSSILSVLKEAKIPIVQSLHEYKLICPVYTMVSNGQICDDCHGKHFYKAFFKRCNRKSLSRSLCSAVEATISRHLGNLSKIDHFIGVSQFMTNQMIRHGVDPDRITTIHNYVDSDFYTPTPSPSRDYFLYFGRLEKVKGIYTLARAAQLSGAKVVVAGTGSEEARYQQFLKDEGISSVELLGFTSGKRLTRLIQNARATVLPSEWYENCPLSVLESFACGTPVVASQIGGIPELVTNNKSGFLFEPGNIEHLASHLSRLSAEPSLADLLGKYARSEAETRFSKETHAKLLLALYQQLKEQNNLL